MKRCKCFSDIVDLNEARLWDTLAVVGSEAPSGKARAMAETARNAAIEGTEALRVHVLYLLNYLSNWNTPRARRIKAILAEYAQPRG